MEERNVIDKMKNCDDKTFSTHDREHEDFTDDGNSSKS